MHCAMSACDPKRTCATISYAQHAISGSDACHRRPGGEDKGQGGKYLLLPPDYKGDVPASYFPVRQKTYDGFWLIRPIPNIAAQSETKTVRTKHSSAIIVR